MFSRLKGGLLLVCCAALAAANASAQTWERLGPEGALVVSLGASPAGVLYLGTTDGHIFVRESGSAKWSLRGRVGGRTDAVVTRLLNDPQIEQRLCAAVWYQAATGGGGVFCSEDAGKTWKLAGLDGEAVRALERAPTDPNEFVAGTRTGVFRSRDAGKNWERISPEGDEELKNLDSVAIDPRDANTIYAGTYHLPWKTTDGGKTWKVSSAGLIDDSDIMSLRIDATDPSRVYLSACSGIYRSEDQGGAWTKLQGIPYNSRRTQAIVQDPDSPKTLYAATTAGLWVTRDGGETWQRTTPGDWVVNSVVPLRGANGGHGQLVIGTEEGIEVSADQGETFTPSNEGLTHTVVKQLIRAADDPRHLAIVVATSTLQILESTDAGAHWKLVALDAVQANKKDALLHAEEIDEIYASPWGWLARLNDGRLFVRETGKEKWLEWKLMLPLAAKARAKNGTPARAASLAVLKATSPIAFGGNIAWINTQRGLVRCERTGRCVALKAFGPGANLTWLTVAGDATTLYAVAGSKLALSRDAGKTAAWRDPPEGAPARSLLVASNNALLLGTDHGLFASSDGGATLQKCQRGLPASRVEQILQTANFMVATLGDGGVYLSRDNATTWERIDHDAERGHFTGLAELEPGVILAGSQSEGVLRLALKP